MEDLFNSNYWDLGKTGLVIEEDIIDKRDGQGWIPRISQ